MKAPIMEVFSSIQGEGLLIGRRQIFVRFAGCNLDCSYCDTAESRNSSAGRETTIDELQKKIESILTPDFHSISFTGGEPLLQADFIKKFLEKNKYKSLLETNGSLPEEVKKLANLISHASVDIKLPEHFSGDNKDDLIEREIDSLNILISRRVKVYCKVVMLPTTKVDTIGHVAKTIKENISDPSRVVMVLQPASPLDYWVQHTPKLFKMSEKVGEHLNVLTIPQVHKLLEVR
jgi:organic radical activating enzyme